MLVIKKLIVVNLKLLAKITPKFFNRVTLVFHGLQKPLHLFVVGCGAFNGSGFRGILVFLTDAANDPIQIAVDVMEEVFLFDGEYTYRCILTNDWDMTDEEIILHYNKRGAAEQVFDRQNNDFGWAHLPKSFMNQNTVFLLITAMAANFYRYIVALPLMAVLFGIKATDRVKSFLFRFIAVPAKWIKTARQYKLNIYSPKPYNQIWEHG